MAKFTSSLKITFYVVLLSVVVRSNAQNSYPNKDVLASYEAYAEMPREIAYMHLNKSTYIKGESIGFKAYIFDKDSKQLSPETTNLYCSISDENNKVIKSKLLLVNKGVARDDFVIDSLFASGEYTVKAYTNWMRNFDEQNFFVQKIKIIDPENERKEVANAKAFDIDAQFLPEGGHLVANTANTIGVIARDQSGYGIAFAQGKVVDQNGQTISTFKLNQFGIGKFNLKPKEQDSYTAVLTYDNSEYSFLIADIVPKGIVLSLTDLKNKVALAFKTNRTSLFGIKGRSYKLLIHNGKNYKETDITFGNQPELLKVIPYTDLYPGMNIFTLFDDNNSPILERLFFNYEGLDISSSKTPVVSKVSDSLEITFEYPDFNPDAFNSVSLSVLPAQTRSYHPQHNSVSYTLVQPYVKGTIQNAAYYFTDISPRKKYELDNLLITQGWSSYNWDNIFNNPPDYDYDFENGISYTISAISNQNQQLMLYPTLNTSFEMIPLNGETMMERNGLYPVGKETIRIGAVNANGKVVQPSLSVQFNPAKIQAFDYEATQKLMQPKFNPLEQNLSIEYQGLDWGKIEKLEEVVIKKQREYTRKERIKNATLGDVEFFDDRKRRQYRYFSQYISSKGYRVYEGAAVSPAPEVELETQSTGFDSVDDDIVQVFGTGHASKQDAISKLFTITTNFAHSLTNTDNIPVIYLDGIILEDLDILYRFRMDQIDYIEINKSSAGVGLRGGGAGVIKIVTDPRLSRGDRKTPKPVYREFTAPLTFSTSKRFYIPKYNSYDSNFFKEYGIIDWIPDAVFNPDGTITVKIPQYTSEVTLFIEGVLNNGALISEHKVVTAD